MADVICFYKEDSVPSEIMDVELAHGHTPSVLRCGDSRKAHSPTGKCEPNSQAIVMWRKYLFNYDFRLILVTFATMYVGAQALEVDTVIAYGHMVVLRPNAVEANAASVRHRKASPEPKLGFMTKAKLVFMPKLLRGGVDGVGIDGSNMKKKRGDKVA